MKKQTRWIADATAALLMAVLALAGCAKKSDGPPGTATKQVRVILDYLPNAVHVGFYQAQAAGYFRDEGLSVRIDAPTSSSDTLRLMAAGQAEFGLVSLLDFMSVRAKGEPLKIVMAVEQRPLAALIALKKSGIARPKDLKGRLVGTTGTLSDEAGVKWMVKHDGGDPATVRLINIGFNTAQEVIAGNVDAAFGFWSQEGVQVAVSRTGNGDEALQLWRAALSGADCFCARGFSGEGAGDRAEIFAGRSAVDMTMPSRSRTSLPLRWRRK